MNDEKQHARTTSALLEKVVEEHQHDMITVEQLKNALHERGFGVLMAIASLPLCIPIPVPPGYTTFFSIPLFIFSIQMIMGMDTPWLPKWLERREIRRHGLAKMIERANPILRKIEKLLKPRMHFAATETGERIIGIVAFICAVSIAVPLPLTNLPPGYGILIMSLGLLGKDGITIIVGIIVGFVGCAITTLILIYGGEAVMNMFAGNSPLIHLLHYA